ncbi:MAG: glycosyltransferase [bacterium]
MLKEYTIIKELFPRGRLRTVSGKHRLKILHIADWHPTKENPFGGIFVREHIKASSLNEDVLVLIVGDGAKSFKGFSPFFKIEEEDFGDGIPTFRLYYKKLPLPLLTHSVFIISSFLALKKLLQKGYRPDVIHAHEYTAGVPATMLGRRYGIPVVISEHWTGFATGKVSIVKFIKAKFAFERADIVCPVSDSLRRSIERLGIKANFRVVPNVVDTSLFYPAGFNSPKKQRKNLLVVALLTHQKGISYLLEALAILKGNRSDFRLDIVGDGPLRGEYEEMVRRYALSEFVQFHGLKPKREVAEFMRRSDLFILPSLYENLPCVLIEAMASGLPIVATNVGGIPEIVSEEVGILVPPKDPQKLAEAISYALDHLERFSQDKISKKAREKYSYEAVGEVFSNLYREVIADKGGIAPKISCKGS